MIFKEEHHMKLWKKIKTVGALIGAALILIVASNSTIVSSRLEAPTRRNVAYLEPTIVFHYHRADNDYTNWDLWLWEYGKDGVATAFTDEDSYGKYVALPLSTWSNTESVYVIARKTDWSAQTSDLEVVYSNFTLSTDNAYDIYMVDLENTLYVSAEEALADKILSSRFVEVNQVEVVTNYFPSAFIVKENDNPLTSSSGTPVYNATSYSYKTSVTVGDSGFAMDFNNNYAVFVTFHDSGETKSAPVSISGLFDTSYFKENSTYSGNDLGVTYSSTSSIFKVWAPTSSQVILRIYENGTPTSVDAVLGDNNFTPYSMSKGNYGVWSVTVNGDLNGKYYTFFVTNAMFPSGVEAVDPYAKAAGVNGERGMILDFSTTDPTGWEDVNLPDIEPTQAAVYEMHVADLTSDSTWNGHESSRKKYLGLIEEGTTYTQDGMTVTTGFDHIKELGVNVVQILPFFDQSNDEVNVSFNWGYNPKNYDVLEGAYSSDPYDGAVRVNEFKQVVQAYSQAGIRIVMDVVYNHVASVSSSSFNKIVPEYYFRYKEDGSLSNGSGVGNDTASERIMMQRFMVDSTAWWTEEYKIGGFRFDLMGLHDVDTMNAISARIHTIDHHSLIYGEPWKLSTVTAVNTTLATYDNIPQINNVGGFNDAFRDGVKGSVFDKTGVGWVQNGNPSATQITNVKNGLLGVETGGSDDPSQVVNYVDCHDNNTLFDKMSLTTDLNIYDENTILKRVTQAAAMTLTAEGISFFQGGTEFLRTKPKDGGNFDDNSYQSSYEVNDFDWDRKITYHQQYEIFRELVALKTGNSLFQYGTREAIDSHVTYTSASELGIDAPIMKLSYVDDNNQMAIYHIGTTTRVTIDLTGYEVVVDTSGTFAVGERLGSERLLGNTTLILKPISGSSTSSDSTGGGSSSNGDGDNGGLSALDISLAIGGGLIILGGGTALILLLKKKKEF
jgi:pullulanase